MAMSDMPLRMLIIGQIDRAEAEPVRRWLSARRGDASLKYFSSLIQAFDEKPDEWLPDLVVLMQSWPDEFSNAEIRQLGRLAPLARWVVCCGAWCQSDGRTRDNWPLAVRIPVHLANARLQAEWSLLCAETLDSIPISASREEIFGFEHGDLTAETRTTVLVSSPDHAWAAYIRDVLQSVGHTVVDEKNGHGGTGPRVVVVDCDPWEYREASLNLLRRDYPTSAIVALFAMPEPDLTDHLLQDGIATVLPKLGSQQRLCDAVAQGAAQRLASATSPHAGSAARAPESGQ